MVHVCEPCAAPRPLSVCADRAAFLSYSALAQPLTSPLSWLSLSSIATLNFLALTLTHIRKGRAETDCLLTGAIHIVKKKKEEDDDEYDQEKDGDG